MKNKVLIIGYGSSGQRYYKLIKKKYPNTIVKIFSNFSENRKNFIKFNKIKEFKPHITLFCNPCTMRIKFLDLIKIFKIVFFEKPLASNLNDGKKIHYLKKNNQKFYVGYNLRYYNRLLFVNKIFRSLVGIVYSFNCESGYFLPNWRMKNYLKSVSAQRKLGGGAILEMSHEIDYISWIFGKNFELKHYKLNSKILNINVEDNVKIIFDFNKKILGSLSLDFLSYKKKRFLIINGSKGSLKADLIKNKLFFLVKIIKIILGSLLISKKILSKRPILKL